MVDPTKVQEIADAAARKRNAGCEFTNAVRAAMRGKKIGREEWSEYFSAVATELGRRGREMRPRRVEPPAPVAEQPAEPQLGFGFGEGPRTKIRPPRRHL